MKPATILVVEDTRELAGALEGLLTKKGYRILMSASGRDALTQALAEKPDLILLDLRLPDMDGFETIRQLRRDPWGKTAAVLVLTAADTSEVIPSDIALPRDKILQKWQWGIENIAARIEAELLNQRSPHFVPPKDTAAT
jgi:DNA-binding response OmpR family regulator